MTDSQDVTIPEQELDDAKNAIRSWAKYDEQVRKMQQAIRERRRMMAVLEPKISEFMERYGVSEFNLLDREIAGKIKLQKKRVPAAPRVSLKKRIEEDASIPSDLKERLLKGGGREAAAQDAAPARTVFSLRRSTPRQTTGSILV